MNVEQAEMSEETTKTRITVWNNDAYEIVGDFDLLDADGNPYRQHGKVRLCRCGSSNKKPYCDNSHIRTGFKNKVSANGD